MTPNVLSELSEIEQELWSLKRQANTEAEAIGPSNSGSFDFYRGKAKGLGTAAVLVRRLLQEYLDGADPLS